MPRDLVTMTTKTAEVIESTQRSIGTIHHLIGIGAIVTSIISTIIIATIVTMKVKIEIAPASHRLHHLPAITGTGGIEMEAAAAQVEAQAAAMLVSRMGVSLGERRGGYEREEEAEVVVETERRRKGRLMKHGTTGDIATTTIIVGMRRMGASPDMMLKKRI